MNDDLIKVAYGIGCVHRLTQHGIEPNDFVKAAAASDDHHAKAAADAVLAFVHYAQAAPQEVEKVASVVFDKTALFEGKNYAERAGQGVGVGAAGGGALGGLLGGAGGGLAAMADARGKPGAIPGALLAALLGGGTGAVMGASSGAVPGALGGLAYEGLRDPSLRERLGLGGGPDPFG